MKLKSHKGAAKRFKKTGSGNFKHRRAFRNHILTKKSTKTMRGLRSLGLVCESDKARVQGMLPNT